jgi:ectoine hydroxylase-related dioxygenase (phytanoyl-CoA dioxygenase family)
VTPVSPAPAALADRLRSDGYVVVHDVLETASVRARRRALAPFLAAAEFGGNSFLGPRTKRVYSLLAKTRAFDDAALHPTVLTLAETLLGPLQLSVSTAIEIHPGESAQTLHADDGIYPLPTAAGPLTLNSMWALSDFTVDNGATRVVPGSHRWPEKRLDAGAEAAAVPAEMKAGSVLVYLGSLLHGGGANRTPAPRLGVVLEFSVGWLRPQENLGLTYPPELVRGLEPRLQELLGYNLYPPFLGYVDGRHPRHLLEGTARGPGPIAGPSDKE